MVARFINGKGIRGMLHYNENKAMAGEAKLLLASGFALVLPYKKRPTIKEITQAYYIGAGSGAGYGDANYPQH